MRKPLHRRPGVSLAELQAKRQTIHDQLHSPEHADRVVTREYGSHDPRIAPFPTCTCGAPGRLQKLPSNTWLASCSRCEKTISHGQANDWSACLQWCEMNLQNLCYRDLPLFDLQDLDREVARSRLKSIYDDLLHRCQIATLDTAISQRCHDYPAPGTDYCERIYAYRDWAKLALRLLKV